MTDSAPSLTSRVVAGAGWMMGWRMVSRMLGFISLLVLAGLLEPGDFGVAALATAVTATVDGLSQLGVRDALVRLEDERPDYYDTAFTFQVARAALTAAVIASMALLASDWLGEPRLRDVLLALSGMSALAGFENIGVVRIVRTLDYRTQFLLQAGPRLVGFLATIALAVLLRSYWALVGGAILSKALAVGVSYVACPHRPRFGLSGWKYLLGFSFWTWAKGMASAAWERADPFLLGPVLGSATLGVYMLASEVAILPVTELIEPACSALFPGFALARRGGSDPIKAGLSIAGALALGAIPFAIGVSACSGYLATGLLGPRWQDAQPVIAAMAWACMFSPFSYVVASALSAQGQVKRLFASNALAAALRVLAVLAFRETRDLALIAAATAAVVAGESLVFIWQMRAAGAAELRKLGWAIARAAASAGVTCACLTLAPGAWAHVDAPRIEALIEGGALGLLTFLIFGSVHALLWTLSGRPDGPEERLADVLRNDQRLLALRASAFRARPRRP